ncbi:Asp-tRNA(Asn)/Glu-tRNA(Gln) amidotransferase GatCAB subunit A [archaeon]|nr:Asp-tRNA(Asn)/Glu-tRNA(Gln) amidotransferase GatCAB subunit A [archaeon]
MVNYNISVQQFLEKSKSGELDYTEFIPVAMKELQDKNKKLHFMRQPADFDKRVTVEASLYGLPISVKDNICVKGLKATAGSKILEEYKPPFDATAVARMREKGARVLCKTNQDEFGFGTFCTNSAYEIPLNPIDTDRCTGGSSGGAASATASLEIPHIALAQSTGGSISCPAAFCSVVGLTPTYGLVSRYGLIDYSNSMDKIGTMGKTVWDAALGLSMIAGNDSLDQTTLPEKSKDYTELDKATLKGKVIGVPSQYFENIDEVVEKKVRDAISVMEKNGAKIKEVSLPMTEYALSAYYIVATAEASTNLAKFCGMRYGLHLPLKGKFDEYFSRVRSQGFGAEAKRRIILGTFARMSGYRDAYYLKSLKVRRLVIDDFKKALKDVDCLAAPTMPVVAPKFKEIEKMSTLQQWQMDVLTVPANLAGLPMISIPCGDMVGLHLIGDHLQESKILEVAQGYEMAVR